PDVSGNYDIRLHTQDLAVMSPSAKPAGDVQLTGKLGYRNQANRSLLRSVTLNGQVASDALSAASSSRRIELRKVHGQYQLANGSFRANGIVADLLGGQINTDIEMRNLDTTPISRVHAALRNISLPAAQRIAQQPELNRVTVTSALSGTATA